MAGLSVAGEGGVMVDDADEQAEWELARQRSDDIFAEIELLLESNLPRDEIASQVIPLLSELSALVARFDGMRPLPISEHLHALKDFVDTLHARQLAILTNSLLLEWKQFREKLRTRQGTVLPDFQALYDQRADLDRQLLEDDSQK